MRRPKNTQIRRISSGLIGTVPPTASKPDRSASSGFSSSQEVEMSSRTIRRPARQLAVALAFMVLGTAIGPAQTYEIVHAFELPPASPFAGLVADSVGNLYGTTYAGGSSSAGTVFRLDPSGNLITLHNSALWTEPTPGQP